MAKAHAHSGDAISSSKIDPTTDQGLVVASTAIGADGRIDRRFTAEGDNVSPPLSWNDVAGAGAYVLIVEDPDAPRPKPFVHWLAWNIPAQMNELPEGLPLQPRLATPEGMVQGRNDMGSTGWFGPKPLLGHGLHRYYFQLFAIDTPLGVAPDTDLETLVFALQARTLAKGVVVGGYEAAA